MHGRMWRPEGCDLQAHAQLAVMYDSNVICPPPSRAMLPVQPNGQRVEDLPLQGKRGAPVGAHSEGSLDVIAVIALRPLGAG